MREKIHPPYYLQAKVICVCGNSWVTGATKEVIRTDVCSRCHPFYTGQQRLATRGGQVERFTQRVERSRGLRDEADRKLTVAENTLVAVLRRARGYAILWLVCSDPTAIHLPDHPPADATASTRRGVPDGCGSGSVWCCVAGLRSLP